jgi:Family of unknown function (DUF5343)
MTASEHKSPPYASYRSFDKFIKALKAHPIPDRIDHSVMSDINYGTRMALVRTLKSLDLINDDGIPTNRLNQFVRADAATRKPILAQLLKDAFPYLWDGSFNLEEATSEQIEERIRHQGAVDGATLRKAKGFLVGGALAAGLTLSPQRSRRAASSANGSVRRPKRVPRARGGAGAGQLSPPGLPASGDPIGHLMNKFPTFDPTWPNDLKTKWFEGFGDLMKQVKPAHPRKRSTGNTEK